jgi:hypothetical protein
MTSLVDLEDAVEELTTQATASFDASLALQASVGDDIALAISELDESVILPVMAMYSGQVSMAASLANINASFITLITPQEA